MVGRPVGLGSDPGPDGDRLRRRRQGAPRRHPPDRVTAVLPTPDGRRAVVVWDGGAVLAETGSDAASVLLPLPGVCRTWAAMTPDGKPLFLYGADGDGWFVWHRKTAFAVYDVTTGERVRSFAAEPVLSRVVPSPDGRLVLAYRSDPEETDSVPGDSYLGLFDAVSGGLVRKVVEGSGATGTRRSRSPRTGGGTRPPGRGGDGPRLDDRAGVGPAAAGCGGDDVQPGRQVAGHLCLGRPDLPQGRGPGRPLGHPWAEPAIPTRTAPELFDPRATRRLARRPPRATGRGCPTGTRTSRDRAAGRGRRPGTGRPQTSPGELRLRGRVNRTTQRNGTARVMSGSALRVSKPCDGDERTGQAHKPVVQFALPLVPRRHCRHRHGPPHACLPACTAHVV